MMLLQCNHAVMDGCGVMMTVQNNVWQ